MRIPRRVFASCLVVAAGVLGPAARAGVDIAFGASVPIADDGRLFFSISSRYFDRDLRTVDSWSRRLPDPDDLSVFLHICAHTRTAPEIIFSYRRQGLSWYDVGVRAGIPVATWYVPVRTDPGPPYGKAYGHWKKHKRNPNYAVRLSDRQVRDLVAVRMAHEYYGVAPEIAMDWRRDGARVDVIMAREYRGRHGGGHGGDHDRKGPHGGKGKDGHARGHSRGRPIE